ncbi:MAG: RNA methyltransferase [Comamonadaceae bacterium]|nr:MAG: RNA methyltransferase [Comamonadaceae bacterium]
MQLEHARSRLKAAGASPLHEQRVLRLWSQARHQDSRKRRIDDYFPTALREALPGLVNALESVAQLESAHPAADGSERLLVRLHDGQLVESVLLPRDGLCISSQVGCAVGCVFCMTGKSGLLRQLGSAEMVAQVALARQRRPVSKVVFMGMGEPSHNLEAVLEAIDFLGTEGNVGHKNIVFSTVGDPRAFERLPQGRVKPALALSLHTTDAALRERLLPRAPRLTPQELVEAADRYAAGTGYPVQYQWTLLEGINDTPAELEGIERLFKGRFGVLNLIPFNAVEGMSFSRPALAHAQAFAAALKQRGILTKLRNSAGQDVDGGCGQLRARAVRQIPIRVEG